MMEQRFDIEPLYSTFYILHNRTQYLH